MLGRGSELPTDPDLSASPLPRDRRPVSNGCSGELSEVLDDDVIAHPGNPVRNEEQRLLWSLNVDILPRSLLLGVIVFSVVALLYYPVVVLAGGAAILLMTPPPRGPLAWELWLRDTVFGVLSYPSSVVFGAAGRSVWSVVNPVFHLLLSVILICFLFAFFLWPVQRRSPLERLLREMRDRESPRQGRGN